MFSHEPEDSIYRAPECRIDSGFFAVYLLTVSLQCGYTFIVTDSSVGKCYQKVD